MYKKFGKCLAEIPIPNYFIWMINEIIKPINLFAIGSGVLYFFVGYVSDPLSLWGVLFFFSNVDYIVVRYQLTKLKK